MSHLEQDEKSDSILLQRRELCNTIFKSKYKTMKNKFEDLYKFLMLKTNCPDHLKHKIIIEARNFKTQFNIKWAKSNSYKKTFLEKEKTWLSGECRFKLHFSKPEQQKGGRPQKDFVESSDGSKRRKTAVLRSSYSADMLTYAAQMKLRAERKLLEAKHVQQVITPKDISENDNKNKHLVTPVQALSLMMEAQLSKKQYNIIKNYAPDLFPSYKMVKKEKNQCYPENVTCTDIEAEVPLQSLLDHTTSRLLQVQEDVITSFNPECQFTMHYKWGFDGSSSRTQYMQKFVTEECDDKYMFLASLVPVRLTMDEEDKNIVIWNNPRPSSPRFCRPIKLQYKKETTDHSKTVRDQIERQKSSLIKTNVQLKDKIYSIQHKLYFTMVDGKVCNALSDTKSTLKCFLCKATSGEFNDLKKVLQKPLRKEYLAFGISVLHAWIRLFEALLHMAYKLEIRSWSVNKMHKPKVDQNKKRIQTEFKEKLSLIIDQPKPGFGNTNNGNVARNFFQNYLISAEITKIDEELIRRFYIILQTISSGYKIDTCKFKTYCLETAKLYVDLYPWCRMTPTVHKILIHGDAIISEHLIPIGNLSEEAQEARNKDFKNYRERFSRKTSRIDNMTDVFNRLLVSSDPLITSIRPLPIMNTKIFHPEAVDMFIDEYVPLS